MRSPVIASFATASLAFLTSVAAAAEPRGPEIGNVRYTASIEFHGTVADTDDYVVTLAAGDKLSVTIAAKAKSNLLPTLVLIDPLGTVIDPAARSRVHGRQLAVGAFTATATGKWAVRIGSSDSTEGAYTAKFHVTSANAPRYPKQHLGGADPANTTYDFDAVAGSRLTLTLHSAGKTNAATIRAVTGPDDAEVPGWRDAIAVKGAVSVIKNLPLGSTSGTFHVEIGVDTGETTCSATLAVTPPARPKGGVTFGDEPWLNAPYAPVDGIAGQGAQFGASHIPVFPPYAKVWIDDKPAAVLSVGTGGSIITVVAPPAPGDTIATVTVQNPDGQATTRDAFFHYVPQGPLDVAAIEPAYARVAQGATQRFKVTLTRVPQPPGIDVALAMTGDLGSLADVVHVPGNTSSATFELVAGQTLATGTIGATYASTVSADVGLIPPGTVAAIVPAAVTLLENTQQTFTVQLSSAAPTFGSDVALSIPSAVGTGPSSVHVAAGKTSATFVLTAGARRGTGNIKATLGGFELATVHIEAPTTLDVSGWTVVQQNASKTYTIPSGTVLAVGDCIVIGKNATQQQFVTSWNTVFSTQVHYFSGSDFPDIDGYETFTLRDKNGNVVDGPTIQMAQMPQNSKLTYTRIAGLPAGLYSSWQAWGMNAALPGTGGLPAPNYPGIYISKFGDADYGAQDFVELFLDQIP